MRNLWTRLVQMPMFVRVGLIIIILLLGSYAFVAVRSDDPSEPLVASTERVVPSETVVDQPSTLPTSVPTAVQAGSSQEEDALKQHYLSVAQQNMAADTPIAGAEVDGDWQARIIQNRETGQPGVVLTLPLQRNDTASNAEFVASAKEQMVQVIRELFIDDPTLERVGLISTVHSEDGVAVPVVSIFIAQQPGMDWATLTVSELESVAQSVYVRADLLMPETAERVDGER